MSLERGYDLNDCPPDPFDLRVSQRSAAHRPDLQLKDYAVSAERGGGARDRQFVAAEACDSFEGLKEDWYGSDAPSGTFGLGGQLPKVIL